MPPPKPIPHVKRQWRKFRRMQRELWETRVDHQRSGWIQLMRVAVIVWRGIFENKIPARAAALSYSSLLAFAPVLGITVLLIGTFMRGDPEIRIKEALVFAVPSLKEYVNLKPEPLDEAVEAALREGRLMPAMQPGEEEPQGAEPLPPDVSEEELTTALDVLIKRMMEGVNQTISGVNSGGGGLAVSLGGLVLIWIGISLLVAVEGAFNDIWGVREGRTWGSRIVIYWAVLSLGTLLGFSLIGFLSASTVAGVLDAIPLAGEFPLLFAVAGPAISFLGLTAMLTLFYKFFPNTHVRTRPALVGGLVVALLLVINNLMPILYINQVIRLQSLYGSVGIILILMFGLYLFWTFLLLGGQITYAMQNVGFLANQKAWNNISLRTRETITFAAFVIICRRFAAMLPPLAADEIADMIRVPNNILNESLNRLTLLDLVTPVRSREDDGDRAACYVPGRPLKQVSMARFRELYVCQGSNEGTDLVRSIDPLVSEFRNRMDAMEDADLANKCIDDLLDEFPADPPMLERERKARKDADTEEREVLRSEMPGPVESPASRRT